MEYRLKDLVNVLAATTSNTVVAKNTKNYDYITLLIATAALTDGTLKIRGSVDPNADLTASRTASNIWTYLHSYNLIDPGSGVAGGTGYTLGASAFAQIKVNVDHMAQIAIEITSQTAGAYTVKLSGVTINGQ